jgi:hypothetical protein
MLFYAPVFDSNIIEITTQSFSGIEIGKNSILDHRIIEMITLVVAVAAVVY